MNEPQMIIARQVSALLLINLLSLCLQNDVDAQQVFGSGSPSADVIEPDQQGLPGARFEWEIEKLPEPESIRARGVESIYEFRSDIKIPFTGLVVGWAAGDGQVQPDHFQLQIRSRKTDHDWSEWVHTAGYLMPSDSPSGYYWSMLYVPQDGLAHQDFEVKIQTPPGEALSYVRIAVADARYEKSSEIDLPALETDDISIIRRENWWGSLPENELEPDYNPVFIDISHAIVHHTVTANNPPNPEQVIRNIWNWHVYENGWLDIGYNFLIDHLGNIYQGRYNPSIAVSEVQGAHAGRSNSSSTGIALLGQFEPGASPSAGHPENAGLESLESLIAWRFINREIHPLHDSLIPVNPSGSAVLPHISGHRQVSATACPGENLYRLLPDIRQGVLARMEGLSNGEDIADEITPPFTIVGNYPNPFQEQTRIAFITDETLRIKIELFNIHGVKLREIFDQEVQAGEHEVVFQPDGLASGVYIYRLSSSGFDQIHRMLHVR
jgi:hypothetical protein